MKPQDLTKAKDPDLLASLKAIKRSAELARKVAMQTETAIIVTEGEKIIRLSAEQLREERAVSSR